MDQNLLQQLLQQKQQEVTAPSPEVVDPSMVAQAAPVPEAPPEVSARDNAYAQRDKQRQLADLLGGFQQIIAAPSSRKADMSMVDTLRKRAEEPVAEFQASEKENREKKQLERQAKKDEMFNEEWSNKLRKSKMDITDREKTADPTSPESQLAQQFILQLAKKNGQELSEETVKKMSAKELHSVSKPMQDLIMQTMKADMNKQKLEQQEKRMKQAEDRLDIYREREAGKQGRFDRSQSFKEAEKQEISDKQTEQLAGYDESLLLLNEALEMKSDVDTGLLTDVSDSMRAMVGVQKPKVSDLKMAIGENLVQKVKQLSGTAASDRERELIQQISLPTLKDNDKIFKSKLKRALKTIEQAKQNRIDSFKKQGKDPSAFEKKAPTDDPRVKSFMEKNGIKDKNKAIEILKKAGKL